jgi:cytoskeletal protein CcmA (bactofilin family)
MMFSKKEKESIPMVSKTDEKSIKAYMGEDTVFNGSLTFDGAVRIDGKFEGQVKTNDTLIVGETGDLKADVTAGVLIAKGKINGTIVATERVEIHSTSKIVGNIQAPSFKVEVGAIFDGHVDMSSKDGNTGAFTSGLEITPEPGNG